MWWWPPHYENEDHMTDAVTWCVTSLSVDLTLLINYSWFQCSAEAKHFETREEHYFPTSMTVQSVSFIADTAVNYWCQIFTKRNEIF
jgi:hypothetical protein